MKKTSTRSKPDVELLVLNETLNALYFAKAHVLNRADILEAEYSQNAISESRERRIGASQSLPENLRASLNAHLNENEQHLRSIDLKIVSLEKKIIFLKGEASGLTKAAKAGATGRKNKYAAMRASALDWYLKERHRFQNKDDAAFEITRLHAVEFSTARGWLKGV